MITGVCGTDPRLVLSLDDLGDDALPVVAAREYGIPAAVDVATTRLSTGATGRCRRVGGRGHART